jgi:cation transport regulator ChaC
MPYYFAYGSCMSQKDISRTVEATFVGPAILENYRLGFTRYSKNRQGGVADIIPDQGERVEGILFRVDGFLELDEREGAPHVYDRVNVVVQREGEDEFIEASTYAIVEKQANDIPPSDEYIRIILEGVEPLSDGYKSQLQRKFDRLKQER